MSKHVIEFDDIRKYFNKPNMIIGELTMDLISKYMKNNNIKCNMEDVVIKVMSFLVENDNMPVERKVL